jgi:spore coat protein U-like protein
MGATAQVTRTCTLSAASLAFCSLSVVDVNNASAVVTLVCNNTSTVTTILVGMGANPAPPTTQRNLLSGTDRVPYTLHVLEAGGADIANNGAVTLVQEGRPNPTVSRFAEKFSPARDTRWDRIVTRSC